MTSRCTICGCQLSLVAGEWWDDGGWQGDARGGQPWHMHQAETNTATPATQEAGHCPSCGARHAGLRVRGCADPFHIEPVL